MEDDDLVVGGAAGELDPAWGGGDGRGGERFAVAVGGARGWREFKAGGEAGAEFDGAGKGGGGGMGRAFGSWGLGGLACDDGFAIGTVGPSGGAFAEDGDGLADEFVIEFHADAVLDSEEIVVAGAFDVFGDVVGVAFDGEGAGAWGVFEDEAVFVAGFFEEVFGGVEVFVGFGGEADDHVAGELDVGDDAACAVEEFEV